MTDDKHVEAIDQAYDRWLATDASAVHFTDCHGFGRRVWHAAFRAAPSAIDSTELARLREIEHVAWHLLDDAEENAQTGDITLFRGSGDYEKLCALLPEDHPSAVTEIGTRHPDAYIEHHKGGNNLVWEETNLPCTPLYKSAPAEVDAPKPSTDYRDAERWRYARDHLFIGYIADDVAESWDDEAIDAAIRSHRGPSTPQEKK